MKGADKRVQKNARNRRANKMEQPSYRYSFTGSDNMYVVEQERNSLLETEGNKK